MDLSDSKKKLALAGIICGVAAACLAAFGNPANMAFCIACFIRDTAGALGMHSTATVQYARPEIIGLVLGAFIISIATKEYRSMAGSSPMVRFVLGMILAVGSLVFLGCPLRMIIRMSAGDLNAWVALIGFVLGVGTGVIALKKGFSLGRAHAANRMNGYVLPVLLAGILILALATTLLKSSESGPGSMHAPILMSLIGGLVFGAVAQKSRMCFAGSIRDVILMKNFDLLSIIGSFFVVMLVGAVSLLGLWMLSKRPAHGFLVYAYLIVELAALVAAILVIRKLQDGRGVLRFRDHTVQCFPGNANYILLYLTFLVSVAVQAAGFCLGPVAVLYAVEIVWLLAMAVYYTVRLM